ncbi:MAG: twin-arginine translocase TatA/TatE family subunit [Planctomycetaceae bacterium]
MPFLGGGMGSSEMIIFAVIALLLFGKRLPEVARSVGSSLMEFKKGMQDVQDEISNPTSTTSSYENSTSDSAASRPTATDDNEEVTAPRFEIPSDS